MFLLEVITPEKIIFSEQVDKLSVPSSDGMLTILPHHANLFAQLTQGELTVTTGSKEHIFSIGSGFIEVTKEKTIVLITRAVNSEELDEAAITKAKESAEEILKQKPIGDELYKAQALLRQSLVDLKLARKRKVHG